MPCILSARDITSLYPMAMATVAINKKLTFCCRRNDRAMMRIVLKERL